MVQKGVEWLDRNSSRRGFLARIGKVLAAAGAALVAQPALATEASAAPLCCSGTPSTCCGAIGACCTGYTYTGYTWHCCYNNRAIACWDCRRSGVTYVCARATQLACP